MSRPLRDVLDRLVEKVDFGPDCWDWTGERNWAGYGRVRVKRDDGTWGAAQAHRFAYELTVGLIPEGLVIDHLCGNRACINPDHLEAVTTQENNLRSKGVSGINATKTHCPNGHPYDAIYGGRRYCRTCHAAHKRRYRRRVT